MALAVAVTLLASCTAPPTTRWDSGKEAPAESPGGVKIPAADWQPCTDVAEDALGQPPPPNVAYHCATVKVPQDWSDPDSGETLDVRLIRARSERLRPGDHIGSLVINPGGPGGSGIDTAVYLSLTLPMEVVREFDIVGFDPRGVGHSSPVECFSDEDKDRMYAAEPDPKSEKDFDEIVELSEGMVDDCEKKYGEDLKYFSTEQTARDM
ncbi:MAG: alpha/beta hydrolase, partial [Micromonosporaceae bacterium]